MLVISLQAFLQIIMLLSFTTNKIVVLLNKLPNITILQSKQTI